MPLPSAVPRDPPSKDEELAIVDLHAAHRRSEAWINAHRNSGMPERERCLVDGLKHLRLATDCIARGIRLHR